MLMSSSVQSSVFFQPAVRGKSHGGHKTKHYSVTYSHIYAMYCKVIIEMRVNTCILYYVLLIASE